MLDRLPVRKPRYADQVPVSWDRRRKIRAYGGRIAPGKRFGVMSRPVEVPEDSETCGAPVGAPPEESSPMQRKLNR